MKAASCMCAARSVTPSASVLLTAILLAQSVCAQTSSSARQQADALFEHGKAALKAGDWQTACADFQRSRELDESASTVVKIARCHEHDGHLSQALTEYGRALSQIRARPTRDAHARDLESLIQSSVAALEDRLAHLRIRLNPQPSRAVVLVDGQPVSAIENSQTDVLVPVDPGRHTVQIQAADYAAAPSPVELAERELLELSVTLSPIGAGAAVEREVVPAGATLAANATPKPALSAVLDVPATQPVVSQPPVRFADGNTVNHAYVGKSQRTLGYVTGGAGIVLALAAGYFGLQTRSYVDDARADNHCDDGYRCDQRGLELIDAARDQQRNAIIAGISSGILVTTGIVLLATAPAKRSDTKRSNAKRTEKTLAVSVSPFCAALGGQW